jgi:hypothetical protein
MWFSSDNAHLLIQPLFINFIAKTWAILQNALYPAHLFLIAGWVNTTCAQPKQGTLESIFWAFNIYPIKVRKALLAFLRETTQVFEAPPNIATELVFQCGSVLLLYLSDLPA